MKVAILCTPRDIHACKWAKALHEAGKEVVFICPEPEARALPYARIIPVSGRNSGVWTYADFWYSAPKVRSILKLEKPDDIHALHITPFGVWGRLTGCRPLTLMALGADVLEYTDATYQSNGWNAESSKFGIQKYFSFIWHRWQVKRTLKYADSVFADNEALVHGIQHLVPEIAPTVKLFTWGIEMGKWAIVEDGDKKRLRQKYHLPESAKIILCPRGLKPIYQAQIILDAIKLSANQPDFFWVLWKGNYEIPPRLQEQILALHAPNFLFIQETLSEQTVQEFFALSDILVSIPVYDGLSASVLQGLASGLYPVLSDIPGNREFLQKGVHLSLIDKIDGQSLLDKVVSWCSFLNREGQKNKVIQNRNWVEKNADINHQVHYFEKIRYANSN